MAFKPIALPIGIEQNNLEYGPLGETGGTDSEFSSESVYFATAPPANVSVGSSINIRMPLYSSSPNYASGMVSLERLYRDYTSDEVASMLIRAGYINSALKYAMLYNYFGYPVANIAADNDPLYAAEDLDSYQFNSQNKFDFKPHLYGYIYNIYRHTYSDDNVAHKSGDIAYDTHITYRGRGIPTTQVYQFGKIGLLPNFGTVTSYEDIKELTSDNFTKFKSFEDLDQILAGPDSSTLKNKLFNALHGSPPNTGWYTQGFVDMIGFSSEASVFVPGASSGNNQNLYLYETNEVNEENVENGSVFQSYKGGYNDYSVQKVFDWKRWSEEYSSQFVLAKSMLNHIVNGKSILLETDNGSAINNSGTGLTSLEGAANGLFAPEMPNFQKFENHFLQQTSWSEQTNPLTKTFCRAWLPSLQGPRSANVRVGSFESYGPDAVLINETIPYTDEVKIGGFSLNYEPEYAPVEQKDNTLGGYNLTFQGSYSHTVNTVGFVLGMYGASGWYEYVNNDGVKNEWDVEMGGYQSYAADPGPHIEESYDKFSTDNIVSQYKLVPGTAILEIPPEGATLADNDQINYFLKNPSKTLNAIMPYVMKYITDVIPFDTPNDAANDWAGVAGEGLNDTDVLTKTQNIGPQDFMRKFRFSTQDMTTFANDEIRIGLGYTHQVGNLSQSGKDLGLSDARNMFTLATSTISQREYLMAPTYTNIIAQQGSNAEYEIEQIGDTIDFLPFDKNFGYDPFDPQLFRPEYLSRSLVYKVNQRTSEFEKAQCFSTALLTQMYLRLPSFFLKLPEGHHLRAMSAREADYYDNTLGNNGTMSNDTTTLVGGAWVYKPTNTIKFDARIFNYHHYGPGGLLPMVSYDDEEAQQNIITNLGSNLLGFGNPSLTQLGNGYNNSNKYDYAGLGYLTFPESFYPNPKYTGENGGTLGYLWAGSPGPSDIQLEAHVGSGAGGITIEVVGESRLSFPVWNYDKNLLKTIDWRVISDDPSKEADLQLAINENQQIAMSINYGIPKWVDGLRIYPTLSSETTITNMPQPAPNVDLGETQSIIEDLNETPIDPNNSGDYILTNNKTSTNSDIKDISSKCIAAAKLVIEPMIFDGDNDGWPTPPSPGFNLIGMHSAYAELKYAVELDIDEKELILDMAKHGIVAFAGSFDDYVKLGFDPAEIAMVAGANVASPSLSNLSEEIQGLMEDGYDFNQFGDLIKDKPYGNCLAFAPPDVVAKATNIKQSNPEDPYACTSYICLNETGAPSVALKASPGPRSNNIAYLSDKTVVKVLKEWVNGKGEYNKVLVVDETSPASGKTGFLPPSVLKTARGKDDPFVFFEEIYGLPLAEARVEARGEMAQALNPSWWKIPLNSVAETSEPYLHIQEGEIHYPVTLDADCIASQDELHSLQKEARIKGLTELFGYYNKKFTSSDIQKFLDSYLTARVEDDDYYIDARPGSRVIMLLKVGAVYLNAVPKRTQALEDLKAKATKVISLNTNWYQSHLQQAVYALNKLYLDMYSSNYRVSGFNFFKETKRLAYIPVILKKMLAANGYETNPQEENIFDIGFDNSYNVVYVSYRTKTNAEKLLDIGFEHFKNTEPFVFPYTMSLLYHHRQIKNPLLKWQTVVEDWMPAPKPKIISAANAQGDFPVSKCSPWLNWNAPSLSKLWDNALGQLADMLDLDPRYDLGSFQFNLLQYFPPCPKPPGGKGPGYLNFVTQINGQSRVFTESEFIDSMMGEVNRVGEYVGDWLSSGEALKDVQTKIFDMDDLYEYVLNYITPELLYSKICKCFIDLMDIEDISVPNLQINATGGSGGLTLNPENIGKNPKEMFDYQGPDVSTSFTDGEGNFKNWKDWDRETIKAEDLFCSFCFRMPSVFLRLPSTDILAELINALKAILEFALAQILMALIRSLLEILLTCPELKCGPEENVGRVEDFGALSIPDLTDGVDFDKCGLLIDGVNITQEQVKKMLLEISNSLTTTEVLGLIDGNASSPVIKSVNRIVAKYPSIYANFSNPAIIEDFFLCVGDSIDPEYLNALLDETSDKFQDPTICSDIKEEAKQKLLDKCGNLENIDQLIQKSLNHDIDKYKKIAKIIRENDDLSNQLPPLFTDGKGTQSLLSGVKFDTLDYALDQIVDTASLAIETPLNTEASNFLDPLSSQMVKDRGGASLYNLKDREFLFFDGYNPDPSDESLASFEGDLPPTKSLDNTMAGFRKYNEEEDSLEVTGINEIIESIQDYVYTGGYQIKLATPDDDVYVKFMMNPPSTVDGASIYANNFTLEAQRIQGTSNPKATGATSNIKTDAKYNKLADDLKEYLEINGYELYSKTTPEQVQTFVNLISNAGELSELFGDNKKSIETIYSLIFASLSTGIIEQVKDNNLLKTFRVDPLEKIGEDELNTLAALFIAFFPVLGLAGAAAVRPFIDNNYYHLKRFQIENISLKTLAVNQQNSGPIPSGIIDFEKMKKIIKDGYDFSKETDQLSEAIQAPQKAFLLGYLQSFLQIFSGQVFAKALYYLPFFPTQIFTSNSELLINYIFETFEKDWLATHATDNFKSLWKNIVCRLVYELPEFKPSPFSKMPVLPGEVGEEFGPRDVIDGTIYDMNLGVEVSIKNWRDATKYFIRQNYESPLRFIKGQLANKSLRDNLVVNPEVNPIEFIAHQNIKQIHDQTLNFTPTAESGLSLTNGVNNKSSLYPADAGYESDPHLDFYRGIFFFQQYIELEELDPYIKVDVIDPNTQAVTDAGYVPELYNENFVNRSPDLKGKLSAKKFSELISTIITKTGTDKATMGYGYDDVHKSKKIKDFFKSIKVGLRMCFGINHYNQLDPQKTFEGIESYKNDSVVSAIDSLIQVYQKNLDDVLFGEAIIDLFEFYGTPEEGLSDYEIGLQKSNALDSLNSFTRFIREDKSFIVFEDVKTKYNFALLANHEYTTEELQNAFFKSEKDTLNPNATGIEGYDIEKLIKESNAKVSFILPVITKDKNIMSNTSYSQYIDRKLYDVADTQSSYESYLENVQELFERGGAMTTTAELLQQIAISQEYRLLFSYAIPVPELINMYLIFFNLILDTDHNVRESFKNTKNVMASSMESIYSMKGKDAYKVTPPSIEQQGGPKGIAQNASLKSFL